MNQTTIGYIAVAILPLVIFLLFWLSRSHGDEEADTWEEPGTEGTYEIPYGEKLPEGSEEKINIKKVPVSERESEKLVKTFRTKEAGTSETDDQEEKPGETKIIFSEVEVRHIWKCAYCDAENLTGTSTCRVCGIKHG